MRRVTLIAFFCLAACGGGIKTPSPDFVDPSADDRARQAVLLSADARATIQALSKVFSQSAIDTCLAAWVDDFGGRSDLNGPVYKPDVAGLRAFLHECLGPAPGDMRNDDAASARAVNRAGSL
jgi:hypothetical protein